MKTILLTMLIVTLGAIIHSDAIPTHKSLAKADLIERDTINLSDTIHITEIPIVIKQRKVVEIPARLLVPYKIENPIDGITLSPASGIIGIGIYVNIQRLYARYFELSNKRFHEFERREIIENYIDTVWLPLTATYTGLEHEHLHYFRHYYRPNIEFITHLAHHDRVGYVIGKVKNYKDSIDYIRRDVHANLNALVTD